MITKKNKLMLGIGIIMAFILTVCVIVLFVAQLKGRKTHFSSNNTSERIASLSCNTNSSERSFFAISTDKAKHEIIVTFNNGKPDKFFYTLVGKYNSEQEAASDASKNSIQYDLYMANNGRKPNSLSTRFSNTNDEILFSVYTDVSVIDTITIPIFLLPTDIKNLGSFSIEELKKIYETEKFNCTISQ